MYADIPRDHSGISYETVFFHGTERSGIHVFMMDIQVRRVFPDVAYQIIEQAFVDFRYMIIFKDFYVYLCPSKDKGVPGKGLRLYPRT